MESTVSEDQVSPDVTPVAQDEYVEPPFGTTWSKLMMWLFIVSDALTFAAFLSAYGILRMIAPEWPDQTEVFDMRLITFMTFALISSSALMAMAVGAARAGAANG